MNTRVKKILLLLVLLALFFGVIYVVLVVVFGLKLQYGIVLYLALVGIGLVFYYLNTKSRTDVKKANNEIEDVIWLSENQKKEKTQKSK